MPKSPGRYPGVCCRSRSAVRRDSPPPGLTRKNKLNSLVGPTLTPGREAPVAGVAISFLLECQRSSRPLRAASCCDSPRTTVYAPRPRGRTHPPWRHAGAAVGSGPRRRSACPRGNRRWPTISSSCSRSARRLPRPPGGCDGDQVVLALEFSPGQTCVSSGATTPGLVGRASRWLAPPARDVGSALVRDTRTEADQRRVRRDLAGHEGLALAKSRGAVDQARRDE